MLPPSDLSNDVILNSTSVISAAPILVANPPIATRTSGVALVLSFPLREPEPTVTTRTHPLALANTCFLIVRGQILRF